MSNTIYNKIDPITFERFTTSKKRQVLGPRMEKFTEDCYTKLDKGKRVKAYFIQTKHNGRCAKCGCTVQNDSAVLHHVNMDTKRYAMSNLFMSNKWNLLAEEDEKCICLCPNCHSQIHEMHKQTGIDTCFIKGTDKCKLGTGIAKMNGSTVVCTYPSISECARKNAIQENKIRYALNYKGELSIGSVKFVVIH